MTSSSILLAQRLGAVLEQRKEALAVAESCTGGLLAGAMTCIPGSSAWFKMGWVTYSNFAKTMQLGIKAQQIIQHGAVSRYTVRHMAKQALKLAGTHWSMAISGVAGPSHCNRDNPQEVIPIGTIWIAVMHDQQSKPWVIQQKMSGNRQQIREKAVDVAMLILLMIVVTGRCDVAHVNRHFLNFCCSHATLSTDQATALDKILGIT